MRWFGWNGAMRFAYCALQKGRAHNQRALPDVEDAFIGDL